MRVPFHQFHPGTFSFQDDPVLVLEHFWTAEEMATFRAAMSRSTWTGLLDMPAVSQAFPNTGNWLKADMGGPERQHFLGRLSLSCIAEYIESFPNITRRHVSFHYYSYGAGDCLPTHDDTDDAYQSAHHPRPPLRRLAVATYLHRQWRTDWGGELVLYRDTRDQHGNRELEVAQCIAPQPGSLVIFTVPRFHRVCRVDPLAVDHKRLSVAGWFMTEQHV